MAATRSATWAFCFPSINRGVIRPRRAPRARRVRTACGDRLAGRARPAGRLTSVGLVLVGTAARYSVTAAWALVARHTLHTATSTSNTEETSIARHLISASRAFVARRARAATACFPGAVCPR